MTKKLVPWKAVRIRKTKNDGRFGASAVPIEKAVNNAVEMIAGYGKVSKISSSLSRRLTHLRPNMVEIGPKNMGDKPMATKYSAFVMLMTELLVLNVPATSGIADSTAVEDTGERNELNDRTKTMICFRRGVKRL